MKIIWKFSFKISDNVSIDMPEGAEILHVEMQGTLPSIWALVDSDKLKVSRPFRVVGTGHMIPDEATLSHVATFQDPPFVWHLFEPLESAKQ